MSRVSGLAELVRALVLRGELRPGERIIEVRLAQRFKTSRSTLREVLRHLEGEGLLVAGDSGGMRVVDPGPEEVAEALEVRAALEGFVAARAAERVRAGAVAAAELERLAGLAGDQDGDAWLADRRFHRAVGALAGNRPCQEALDRLWDRLVVARPPRTAGDGEHRALLAAIGGGDPEAAAGLARRHALALRG